MHKKLLSILTFVLFTLILVACDNGTKEVQLPVLNGQTQSQITTTLNELDATFTFEEETNFNIAENTFIRYGNNLAAGMMVDLTKTELVIYIANHDRILPDLTGKTELEATRALTALGLQYNITYRETPEYEDGMFIEYGGTFHVGQVLEEGSRVAVVISKYPSEYKSPIFMSKYVSSSGNDRAIEIFNSLDVEISLDGYKLDFYLDGSSTVSNTYEFPTNTKLAAGDTLLLVHPEASSELLDKADVLTDELTFVGKDYIELLDHSNSLIDSFGIYEVYVMNFNNRIMVRNENIVESNPEFVQSEWDIYHKDYYQILDSHPTIFPKRFTFLEEDLLLDYYNNPRGMVKVEHDYSNDGDTSYFTPGFEGNSRVRYIGINAPEMTPSPEPHAQAATTFLNNLLNSATDIYIQHDPYYGVHDHYNRSLGLVWADGQLANYLMVLNGYSQNFYNDPEEHFIYNGITLNEWFRRAEASARAQKLGIWS